MFLRAIPPLIAALAIGGVLRLVLLFDDFWLDEIWSLELASEVRTARDILLLPELRHDNNHPLTTWTLHLFGQQTGWIVYRLPPLFAGLLSVGLAVLIGARQSRTQAWVLGLLFALSGLMVAYAPVARGYALAIAFALAAWGLVGARGVTRDGRLNAHWAPAFWLCVGLGMLSHLTFVQVYLGLSAWMAWSVVCSAGQRGRALLRALIWHGPALAFSVWLYQNFVAELAIGGAPIEPAARILARALAWMFGGPDTVTAGVLVAVLVGSAWIGDAWATARRGSDEWVFSIVAVGLAPVFTLLAFAPAFLLPRYFLVTGSFLLLACGRSLARGWSAGGAVRVLSVALLVAFSVGNVVRLVPLLRYGRGGYSAAVTAMVDSSTSDTIRVGSDHDLRSGKVLAYYGRRLERKIFQYVPQTEFRHVRPEWFVMHSKLELEALDWLEAGDLRYRLVEHFPYAAPDGFHWWLYRRDP